MVRDSAKTLGQVVKFVYYLFRDEVTRGKVPLGRRLLLEFELHALVFLLCAGVVVVILSSMSWDIYAAASHTRMTIQDSNAGQNSLLYLGAGVLSILSSLVMLKRRYRRRRALAGQDESRPLLDLTPE